MGMRAGEQERAGEKDVWAVAVPAGTAGSDI